MSAGELTDEPNGRWEPIEANLMFGIPTNNKSQPFKGSCTSKEGILAVLAIIFEL